MPYLLRCAIGTYVRWAEGTRFFTAMAMAIFLYWPFFSFLSTCLGVLPWAGRKHSFALFQRLFQRLFHKLLLKSKPI